MAQEIMQWCDPHYKGPDHERRPVIFAGVIKIGELEKYTELCEQCFKITKRVAAMIEEFGIDPKFAELGATPAVDQEEATKKPHKCPRCEKRYTARTSLSNHCRENHGTTLRELEKQDSGEQHRTYYEPRVCLIRKPDGEICNEECASPQGLGAHQRAKHGIVGSSDTAIKNRAKLITRSEDKPRLVEAS